MSRWLDREEEKDGESSLLEGLSRSGAEKRPRVPAEADLPKSFGQNQRERVVVRDQAYRIRPSELEAMNTVGRFRLVEAEDLVRGVYGGETDLSRSDLRALKAGRLIRSIPFRGSNGKLRHFYTLTGEGHRLVSDRSTDLQQFYWGVVKPSECEHDVLLYRAYVHEERRISESGGSVKRVVLDYELKRAHFSRLNKRSPEESYRRLQAEIARELHLPIVDGHVVFPDFRVEYEDERGEPGRADIEVATGNYREKHVATKAAAGFRIYADRSGGGGRLGMDEGEPLRGNVFRQDRGIVLSL